MIIRPSSSWSGLVFLVRRGTIIEKIWLRFLVAVAFSVLVTYLYKERGLAQIALSGLPFTVTGLALSIFLGFRNAATYDRFWEGRKLWGALVNTARTFTRQVLTCWDVPEGQDEEARALKERMVRRMMGYVHGLRLHLRKQPFEGKLTRFLPEDEDKRLGPELNKPIALLQWMADDLAEIRKRGWIDNYHHVLLEEQLTACTNIQGGCERILATPVPLSHTALTHRLVGVYSMLIPLGLVEHTSYATPLMAALVAYAFYGLDALGEELEDPFGEDCNDLPLTYLSTMIEHNLRQRLGDDDLPELPRPNGNDVLN